MKKIIVFILLLAITGVTSAEILTNPGFEAYSDDGWGSLVPDGWGVYTDDWGTVSHGAVDGSGNQYEGTVYWSLSDSSAGTPLIGLQDIGAVADTSYTFSVWLKDPGDNQVAKIGFDYFAADWSAWWGEDVIDVSAALTGEWQLFTHTVDKWAGSAMKVKIVTENGGLWADSASLVPEPMTIGLLGLGALFLRRRRK